MEEKGQSLLELTIAIGIFVTIISGLAFFILNSYISGRLSYEMTKANFLAEEGIEATRSIRDNKFSDLVAGNRGLAISGGHWIFQGTEEDISNELRGGVRKIEIEDIDQNRKKVTSRVNWQFAEGRAEEVRLITYLTNWQKVPEIKKPTTYTDFAGRTASPHQAYDSDGTTYSRTRYDITRDPSITFYSWESATQPYTSLTLKYRYHADSATNDQYAVAYSINGCTGTFFDLISLTSAGAPDTTVSVELSSDQDLSQLCLKIYSRQIGSADGNRRIYTRDIWTEGI